MKNKILKLISCGFLLALLFSCVNTGGDGKRSYDRAREVHPIFKEVIEAGPYQALWSSLDKHEVPQWYRDSKVGISAHWGVYAVPGWTPKKDTPYGVAYAEWYWMWLQQNPAVKTYHKETYGDANYDDFINGTKNLKTGEIDGFFTEDFDAEAWMQLFKDAGAKYFFITSKHHDGYCLWDTDYTDRSSAKSGPYRDLLEELVNAARKLDMKVGFYYSFYEWFNPIYDEKAKSENPNYFGLKDLKDENNNGILNEYVDDYMIPQLKELIDKFQPDCLYFDGEWEHGFEYWRGREIIAYYYNQAHARGQEVLVNDRFGQAKEGLPDTRGRHGDLFHVEYFANIDRTNAWAMWRGFGNSYGYNRNEAESNILTIKETIQEVVNVVSDNGNIEFNIGPKADGTLADFEVERLEAMGKWLKVNGEAIYNCDKSEVRAQKFGKITQNFETKNIYLHVYDWPENGLLKIKRFPQTISKASLLDGGAEISFSQDEKGLELILPENAPDPYVSVIKLTY